MQEKSCGCGSLRKDVPCCESLRCQRKCAELRNCGRHACRRRCCDGDHPTCQKVCAAEIYGPLVTWSLLPCCWPPSLRQNDVYIDLVCEGVRTPAEVWESQMQGAMPCWQVLAMHSGAACGMRLWNNFLPPALRVCGCLCDAVEVSERVLL